MPALTNGFDNLSDLGSLDGHFEASTSGSRGILTLMATF